jgi:hypothetical protein
MRVISIARVRVPVMLYKLYSITDCVSDRLSDYVPINFGAPNIKHSCLLSYPRQSLRQSYWDSNTRYRDSPDFQDPLRLEKGYMDQPPSEYKS